MDINWSILPVLLLAKFTNFSIKFFSDKSPQIKLTFAPLFSANCFTDFKPSKLVLVVKVRETSFEANFFAVAAPIPDAAPVINIDIIFPQI